MLVYQRVKENKHIETAKQTPSNKIPEELVQEILHAVNIVCFK
jgi:hypothetical protein